METATQGDAHRTADMDVGVDSVSRIDGVVSMIVKYTVGELLWTHSFHVISIADDQLLQLLRRAGFGPIEWPDERRTWCRVEAIEFEA